MFNSTREFEATVLVRGKPVTEVVHNGRTFIEGRKKSSYELYFRNNTNQTVLVVPSVDGLSVIDGQPAGKESPGFVVDRWSEVTIPGWTFNGREAAEFIFHAQGAYYEDEETYVEAMGEDPRNQGAIGFMVFRQQPRLVWPTTPRPFKKGGPDPFRRRYGAAPSTGGFVYDSHTGDAPVWDSHTVIGSSDGGVRAMNVSSSVIGSGAELSFTADSLGNQPSHAVDPDEGKSLGTGFGEAVEFETQQVEFQREADPCAVFAFFYDTKKNLRKMGVPVEEFSKHYSQRYDTAPDPFPTSPEVSGYANAPKGWTGRRRNTRRRTRS